MLIESSLLILQSKFCSRRPLARHMYSRYKKDRNPIFTSGTLSAQGGLVYGEIGWKTGLVGLSRATRPLVLGSTSPPRGGQLLPSPVTSSCLTCINVKACRCSWGSPHHLEVVRSCMHFLDDEENTVPITEDDDVHLLDADDIEAVMADASEKNGLDVEDDVWSTAVARLGVGNTQPV
ncbi:hypothetical protein V6N13_052090 [Hibiscus sabdariffa]